MASIEHVVVLMLENRSFDHLLGFLDHPRPAEFDGLHGTGPYDNPDAAGVPVAATPDATAVLPIGPAHSHREILEQLAPGSDGVATNRGFVASYARTASGSRPLVYRGLIGRLLTWWSRWRRGRHAVTGVPEPGRLVMRCHTERTAPVMHALAREFAVCTRWFCSVPGETWPNRNYVHAATSDGETAIRLRSYENRTIFELLEEHGRDWRIYHADTPQIWAFPRLWDDADRHRRWFPLTAFGEHVAADDLPHYSFIEPDHGIPVVDRWPGSNSQHPENNLVPGEQYASYAGTDSDFARGEQLIADVYETLRRHPGVFERTLLLITYDEHGGFYDHVPPPTGVPAPPDPGPPRRWLDRLYRLAEPPFDFTRLGPRVPALVVSPLVPRGHVDDTVRDHAAVPATLRALFAPTAEPLTSRDRWSAPFHEVASLDAPRRGAELPDLSAHRPPSGTVLAGAATPDRPPVQEKDVPAHLAPFAGQAALVNDHLHEVGEPEIDGEARDRPGRTTQRFAEAAARHRADGR
jgi:phospholipase C